MTQDFEESARNFLSLLNRLPSTPSITFRGFVDTSVTQARIVVSPALTATSHSIAIATNNLRTPHVGVVVGANGRDMTALMAGAPTVNLQEVTYLPGTYFCQHPAQEFAGVDPALRGDVRERGWHVPEHRSASRLVGSDPRGPETRAARRPRALPRPASRGLGPFPGPRPVTTASGRRFDSATQPEITFR